ncbi:hypothetical protein LTR70_005288 [Exophiala xenobiotica]|uniref:GST N-terminal domain-containing protein n=1 Tax=Lithohypha guttulata TaxID=1690604 RepID=A0ABR0KAE0_9EURO|nr:hypothetical protein LTR24_004908 [Lithohypha guttulata]KAK5318853.1 hypothetical protein LTR70_005288 [Exophiala xenobiotica]
MDVDPRLQLSDLTDYQLQASLAQQYDAYNPNGLHQATRSRFGQNTGYFQPIPQNEAQTSSLRSSQQFNSQSSPQRNQCRSPAQNHGTTSYQQTPDRDLSQSYGSRQSPATRASPNITHANSSGIRQSIAVNRHNSIRSTLGNAGGDRESSRQNSPTFASNFASGALRKGDPDIKDPTTFVPPHLLAPMKPSPPSLREWRNKFFNIEEPLLLTGDQYLTYFPHVDNVYSHRSTQKHKRKPFVSHYWDCRLKGRPTGTPMNKKTASGEGDEQEKKKRKRKVRERDLCDVKIKVTEFFGTNELEALQKLGFGLDVNPGNVSQEADGDLSFVINGQQQHDGNESTFGILEPSQNYPPGHPGYGGKKWYMVQRVNGNDKDGEGPEDRDLDHKHTLDESDRIKKNSVQRWLLAREKEKKKAVTSDSGPRDDVSDDNLTKTATSVLTPPSRYHASGSALQTVNHHTGPTLNNLTFYGCSFCPFAQRVWIALEAIGVPYRYVEVTEQHFSISPSAPPRSKPQLNIPELAGCNPEGKVPCIKHNNFCVWESLVMLEYLEDLAMGPSLFQPAVGNAQLKAHSRLWVDFINRRILPAFYALLLLPDQDETGHDEGQNGSADQPTNFAERNAHANPSQTLCNDETYQIPKTSFSFFPSSKQCDPSTLPPSTQASAQFPTQFSIPTTKAPPSSPKAHKLTATLVSNISILVNASHRTGPYFLGPTLSYVDIAFAPWIIRLNYVLSHYRGFPRPEVGTRWRQWCEAVQANEVVNQTVSDEGQYRLVYGGGFQAAAGGGDGGVSGGGKVDRAATAAGGHGWQYDVHGRFDVNKAFEARNGFPEMGWVDKTLYGASGIDGWDQRRAGDIFGYTFDQ